MRAQSNFNLIYYKYTSLELNSIKVTQHNYINEIVHYIVSFTDACPKGRSTVIHHVCDVHQKKKEVRTITKFHIFPLIWVLKHELGV